MSGTAISMEYGSRLKVLVEGGRTTSKIDVIDSVVYWEAGPPSASAPLLPDDSPGGGSGGSDGGRGMTRVQRQHLRFSGLDMEPPSADAPSTAVHKLTDQTIEQRRATEAAAAAETAEAEAEPAGQLAQARGGEPPRGESTPSCSQRYTPLEACIFHPS